MENEEDLFPPARNSDELRKNMRTHYKQVNRDETSLRRPES